MKTCTECDEMKPLEAFSRLRKAVDGRQPRCKKCVAAYMRSYYRRNRADLLKKSQVAKAKHPERYKQYDRVAAKRHNAKRLQARRDAKATMLRFCMECGEPIATYRPLDARFCSADVSRSCQQKWRHRHASEAVRAKETERKRRWKKENPEKAAAARKRYRLNNPESLRRKDQRRRATKRAAFVEDVHPLIVLERSDGVCGICGEDVDPFAFDIDHIVPLARGGLHNYANTQAAHDSCNSRKAARLEEELVGVTKARY